MSDMVESQNPVLSPAAESNVNKKREFGCGVCILDKGFMYIGHLETDGEFWTIRKPMNIRYYSSGKGLLWHVGNGSEDMTLDKHLSGTIMMPYNELKHFIPTDENLWY